MRISMAVQCSCAFKSLVPYDATPNFFVHLMCIHYRPIQSCQSIPDSFRLLKGNSNHRVDSVQLVCFKWSIANPSNIPLVACISGETPLHSVQFGSFHSCSIVSVHPASFDQGSLVFITFHMNHVDSQRWFNPNHTSAQISLNRYLVISLNAIRVRSATHSFQCSSVHCRIPLHLHFHF